MPAASYSAVFRDRRLAVILLLGFSSGLPLALTGGTLQAWMTVEGVDLSTIGIFTLVGLPYTWKFLWAPLMDRFVPPFLGRRRGWLLVTQLSLAALIAAMAFASPRGDLAWLALLAVAVAFASASQDIVFDAYRTDVAKPEQRGLAAAFTVVGYRVAMLTSGAAALVLVAGSGFIPALGWKNTYLVMAGLMGLGALATLWGPEPEAAAPPPRSLDEAVWAPLKEFFSRNGAWVLLALIVLYKLGDAFAGSLTTAFLLRGAGFALDDVGYVNKGMGLAATIFGALFGGALMVRLGLYRALMAFGVLQAVSNLAFMALAAAGKSWPLMVFAVGFENLSGGMGTAAFVALLMALCDHRFTATQYALLSALASFGRVYVGPAAGYATDPKYLGLSWAVFFFLTFLLALPGLALLWWKRETLKALG
ncbi:MAG TPA: MFS transporter [Usitatibacteraceae bacterium]|nr:MFS transporter [Burkholderiales bacterium]HQY47851.1 MFS transporter [Usitatibacteraceae bacterium]